MDSIAINIFPKRNQKQNYFPATVIPRKFLNTSSMLSPEIKRNAWKENGVVKFTQKSSETPNSQATPAYWYPQPD